MIEGGAIMVASLVMTSRDLRGEFMGAGKSAGKDSAAAPSKLTGRIPEGTPLLLSAIYLIILAFLVDLVHLG